MTVAFKLVLVTDCDRVFLSTNLRDGRPRTDSTRTFPLSSSTLLGGGSVHLFLVCKIILIRSHLFAAISVAREFPSKYQPRFRVFSYVSAHAGRGGLQAEISRLPCGTLSVYRMYCAMPVTRPMALCTVIYACGDTIFRRQFILSTQATASD